MKISELEIIYKQKQDEWKLHIRQENNKFKRLLKWIWYLLAFPFVWLFYNIRDWRTLICILISFIIVSSSVWIWFLLGIILGWNSDTAKWFIGIGTTVFVWWASPVGSPFILVVTILAIGIKALYNKIRIHRIKKKDEINKKHD